MKNNIQLFLMWLVMLLCSIWVKPFIPIDETRYVSVAWEMWNRADCLVPYLNGSPYSHKPPLMFWLFHAGWAIFGVNEWWPKLILGLFGLGSLFLTSYLAKLLWPENKTIREIAPFILLGCLFWTAFSISIMFDVLLAFFNLVCLVGALKFYRTNKFRWWVLTGVGIFFGIMSKGVILFVFLLPGLLLAPFWNKEVKVDWKRWYLGVLVSLIIGIALALCWAIPAAIHGGEVYRQEIFMKQTVNRMVNAFDHKREFWWYIPFLPLILLPWSVWIPLWKSLKGFKDFKMDMGLRFCSTWFLISSAVLFGISGKQTHYFIPLLPAFSLLAACNLSKIEGSKKFPFWAMGIFMIFMGTALIFMHQIAGKEEFIKRLENREWFAHAQWIRLSGGLIFILGVSTFIIKFSQSIVGQVKSLTVICTLFMVIILIGLIFPLRPMVDLHDIGNLIKKYQDENKVVVYQGRYQGQYNFVGRLTKKINKLEDSDRPQWIKDHPDSYIIRPLRYIPENSSQAVYFRPYLDYYISLWQAKDLTF